MRFWCSYRPYFFIWVCEQIYLDQYKKGHIVKEFCKQCSVKYCTSFILPKRMYTENTRLILYCVVLIRLILFFFHRGNCSILYSVRSFLYNLITLFWFAKTLFLENIRLILYCIIFMRLILSFFLRGNSIL